MDPGFALICAFVAAWLVFRGAHGVRRFVRNPQRRIDRLARSHRRQAIARVLAGWVKIAGTVKGRENLMVAPLSGRPCAAWTIVVERRVDDTYWREAGRGSEGRPFEVVDSTGVALVDLGTLFEVAARLDKWQVATNHAELAARFTSMAGVPPGDLRLREGTIVPGERVVVVGLASWEPDLDQPAGGRREMPLRLVIRGTENCPLLLTDAPDADRHQAP